MKVSLSVAKILAALVIALTVASYLNHDYAKWHALGRDAFLGNQASRFDRYMTHPQWGTHIFAAIIAFGALFLIYELLSALFAKLLPTQLTTNGNL